MGPCVNTVPILFVLAHGIILLGLMNLSKEFTLYMKDDPSAGIIFLKCKHALS